MTSVGRKPLMSVSDFKKSSLASVAIKGKSMYPSTMREILENHQRQSVLQGGRVPVMPLVSFSLKTVHRYMAVAGSLGGMSVTRKVVTKTRTRKISENSIRCVAAYMCITGATHYFPTSNTDMSMYRLVKNATKGAQTFFDMVAKAYGEFPLDCVRPCYLTSSDDIATFAFTGTQGKEQAFRLVGTNSAKHSGMKSKYTTKEQMQMNGIRVKLSNTFCMSGVSASIFISVSGLMESELPRDKNPTGMLLLEIPGLTVGGGGVTLGDERVGMILFMRREKGMDEARY